MFRDLPALLQRIKQATDCAERGVRDCCQDRTTFRTLEALLECNKTAEKLLKSLNHESAEWINNTIRFLYLELVREGREGRDAFGHQKHSHFARLSCLIEQMPKEIQSEARRQFSFITKIMSEYSSWVGKNLYKDATCLVVTALPIEFRAIVRRLGILRVRVFPHANGGLPYNFDPFMHVWEGAKDEDEFSLWSKGTSPKISVVFGLFCNSAGSGAERAK